MNLKRITVYYYLRLRRLQGTPRALAMGAAVGAAIGITPTLPFHTVMILTACLIMRVNPIAAIIAGTIVSNPLTFIPHYYAAWWLGDFFLPDRLTWLQIKTLLHQLKSVGILESLQTIWEVGLNTTLVMMTGGLLLAIPTGIFSYILAFKFFVLMQRKRHEKHLLNHQRKQV